MALERTGKYSGLISSVTFQLNSGGSPITWTGITAVKVMVNDQLLPYTGDAAVFATLLASVLGTRGLQLTSYDVSQLLRTVPAGPGTLTVVVEDAFNTAGGAGSGQVTYVLINACRQELGGNHANQSQDSAGVTFNGYSDDGTTDPLTITEA